MYMPNTRTQRQGIHHNLYSTCSRWGFGVWVGGDANFSVRIGGNTNFSIFRYQHVGTPNTKLSRWGYCPTRQPNASVFASQWNIGYNVPLLLVGTKLQNEKKYGCISRQPYIHVKVGWEHAVKTSCKQSLVRLQPFATMFHYSNLFLLHKHCITPYNLTLK